MLPRGFGYGKHEAQSLYLRYIPDVALPMRNSCRHIQESKARLQAHSPCLGSPTRWKLGLAWRTENNSQCCERVAAICYSIFRRFK
jgi:hypothetical protein